MAGVEELTKLEDI